MTRGLLIVDVQEDFVEGGSLAVSGGRQIAKQIGYLLAERQGLYTHVYVSQDWHKPLPDLNGGHFAPEGTDPDYVNTWPVHCVAGTRGAELVVSLRPVITALATTREAPTVRNIRKGQGRPDYSAFQGLSVFGMQRLRWELESDEITGLDVCGIATDHCVRASALDALSLGLTGDLRLDEVRVITDLIAGVDATASAKAMDEVQDLGGTLTTTDRL